MWYTFQVEAAKQPTIAIIVGQYYEKTAVDAMMTNRQTFVRYATVGKSENLIYMFFLFRAFCIRPIVFNICKFLFHFVLLFRLNFQSLFVMHMKDHFGSIHSNEQNLVRQHFTWFQRSQKWIDPFPTPRTVREIILSLLWWRFELIVEVAGGALFL